MTKLVDLVGTIPWSTLQAAGYDGAFGYSSHHQGKCPAATYGETLVNQGGLYAIVFEDQAQRALDGYSAGRADAIFANLDADGQHYPDDCAIYWTADFDGTWQAVSEYARGWHENSKRPVGVYANGEIIRAAKAAGYVTYGWRTCSGGFRGSKDLTDIDLVQMCVNTSVKVDGETWRMDPVAGYSVDTNRTLPGVTNIGAWGQQAPAPQPPKDWLMALTDDEQKDLYNKVKDLHADYSVSREPDPKKPGDNGTKRWQIGQILTIVRSLRK